MADTAVDPLVLRLIDCLKTCTEKIDKLISENYELKFENTELKCEIKKYKSKINALDCKSARA